MEIINKNIRFLREQAGWTQKELADKAAINKPMIGAYEEFRSIPLLPIAVKLADAFGVDLDTFVRVDLGKNAPRKSIKDKYKRGREILAITVDSNSRENVELVSQKASAGYLSGFNDPEYIRDLPKIHIPVLSRNQTYRGFEITKAGDSMLPVNPRDIIIGQYVNSLEEIKDGKTYVIVSPSEGIAYKRVFKFLKEEKLLLVSDNRAYAPYLISFDSVAEIWAFAGRITLKETEVEEPKEKMLDFIATQWMETLKN